jgi:hypothetical protein
MHNSFFLYVYLNSLHVSSNLVLIIRRINCINTTSGIDHPVGDRLVCRATYTRHCIDTIDSSDEGH